MRAVFLVKTGPNGVPTKVHGSALSVARTSLDPSSPGARLHAHAVFGGPEARVVWLGYLGGSHPVFWFVLPFSGW